MTHVICRSFCFLLAAFSGVGFGYFAGTSLGIWTIIAVPLAICVFLGFSSFLLATVCRSVSATNQPAEARAQVSVASSEQKVPVAAASAPAGNTSAMTVSNGNTCASVPHWSAAVDAESGRAGISGGQSELVPSQALSEEPSLRDSVGTWRYEGCGQPVLLAEPRDQKPDDLTVIKGIGKKVEQALNGLGIYHIDQIARWSAQECEWVDAELPGFKGRVGRDNWVDQAKAFAHGNTAS